MEAGDSLTIKEVNSIFFKDEIYTLSYHNYSHHNQIYDKAGQHADFDNACHKYILSLIRYC